MNELDNLAIKYNTDKSSLYHNYTNTYHKFLNIDRDNVKNVLELGIQFGGSLRMWRDYFRNATVYGIDIKPDYKFEEERIITLIGSQIDNNLIQKLPNNFDIIIDDGSHQSIHQIESFNMLFQKLKSGGMYIIEDACCSYWNEFNVNSKQTAIEYFKTLIDHVNFFGYKVNNDYRRDGNFILNDKKNASEFERYVDYIIFANSLIFIKKI